MARAADEGYLFDTNVLMGAEPRLVAHYRAGEVLIRDREFFNLFGR